MRQRFNLRFFFLLLFFASSVIFLTPFLHSSQSDPRTALMIGRFQPLHNGHLREIELMFHENDTVIVGVGSSQLTERSKRNPLLPAERCKMLSVVTEKLKPTYTGKEIFLVPLADIDSEDTFKENPDNDRWITHVLNEIKKNKRPAPTDYYTGSKEDAFFYCSYFADPEKPDETITATQTCDGGNVSSFTNKETGRQLHIINRYDGENISATKVRAAIAKDFIDPKNPTFGLWKQFVPEELHLHVEEYSELAKDVLTE